MRMIFAIFKELFGLFVDDTSFAAGIFAWLMLSIFLLPHLGFDPDTQTEVWVGGLVLLLLENIYRTARRVRLSK